MALAQASDIYPNETHTPFRWQTEKKEPFPTLTRRAQFYIDHEWFLEAGEELPAHKEAPAQGGDHPLQITGGHPRWSVNSMCSTTVSLRIEQSRHFLASSEPSGSFRSLIGLEPVEDQTVKGGIPALEMPSQVGATPPAQRVGPGAAREPAELEGRLSHHLGTRGSEKATELELDPRRIGAAVYVLPFHDRAVVLRRHGSAAKATSQPPFQEGVRRILQCGLTDEHTLFRVGLSEFDGPQGEPIVPRTAASSLAARAGSPAPRRPV